MPAAYVNLFHEVESSCDSATSDDDGKASRSLFDAVAEMTGLVPMVRELETRLATDAE